MTSNQNEADFDEKYHVKYQTFAYLIGFLLVGAGFAGFYYITRVQNEISGYRSYENQYQAWRNDLTDLASDYASSYAGLFEKDVYVENMLTQGFMTPQEANNTITAHMVNFRRNFMAFSSWLDEYDEPDVNWLFSRWVFIFHWVAFDLTDEQFYYDEIYDDYEIDDVDTWGNIWETPTEDPFLYNYTLEIAYWELWDIPILIRVQFEEYDEYIQNHYIYPRIDAEQNLIRLQIAADANTIGILILSFIIDYGNVHKFWKVTYSLLAAVTVVLTGYWMILAFIS